MQLHSGSLSTTEHLFLESGILKEEEMKRPNFQEKTEVKVIDSKHYLYSKRGVVTAINGFDDSM